MKRTFTSIILACVLFLCVTSVQAEGWSVSGLTDLDTSMLELRIGKQLDQNWTAGLLGTWFSEDAENPGADWGIGAYGKLVVDPNASFPIANWLPKIGDWLHLPESVTAETYLIGKFQVLPYEDNVDMVGSIGGGAQVGPAVFEVVYDVIESGDADNPVLASGLTLWAGLCIPF